jgi:hypothetical protein
LVKFRSTKCALELAGSPPASRTPRLAPLAATCRTAGIDVELRAAIAAFEAMAIIQRRIGQAGMLRVREF